jgi:hypothetical protein
MPYVSVINSFPPGTPDPNFVVGEGCGSRKFEQNVMPHVHDAQSFVVGGENAVRGSLPWQARLGEQEERELLGHPLPYRRQG